ncbi:D-glutamate cyclase, mitochondrial isoform X3 [Malaclemys terrapin pileata]|uniref:D-glutamate cyclase, mitochondrial isoform X3 n=1 Tax=Malaclemys terrapin pileata TaxID=2991368 RepID=UPI0023A8E5EC|nr:D-glutamate cyclase, mitochondrial isoform X3 [Malaclemys terrapin pileata]
MFFTGGLRSLLPLAVRSLIRFNKLNISNTSGMAKGYKLANVVILHKSLADDFEKFCHANDGPLPLLYRSKPGEWKCPSLSSNSDIRTDCQQYRIYEYGACTGTSTSLKDYFDQLKDMVTFYLGCSFSFEKAAHKVGVPLRNVEQKCNVSMYKTDMPCCRVASFCCNLVVTMRPIPEDQLEAVVEASCPLKDSHGAPVHIGNPGLLGIQNLSSPDYGDPVQPHPQDVPVFWACGVTGVEAVSNCKSPLAFTHFPGCMFITALKNEDAPVHNSKEIPTVHCISQNALHYSIASETAVQKIRELESLIGVDPGVLKTPVPLLSYQGDAAESALMFLCENGNLERPRFDHLIAIERAGMAADGNYYNARKVNIKHLVDPIDELFLAAHNIPGVTTTGIGDGGNELGMGKVKEAIRKHIKNGDVIACDVEADFAIVAGVSNWGGYAVACALYILNTCEIHDRYLRKAIGFPRLSKKANWASALPSITKDPIRCGAKHPQFSLKSVEAEAADHCAKLDSGCTDYPSIFYFSFSPSFLFFTVSFL